jgi:gliding motility-associated-like protein
LVKGPDCPWLIHAIAKIYSMAFQVVTIDVDPATSVLRIFDRWGLMIYEDKGLNPSWNGLIDGSPAPIDSYLWHYSAQLKCGFEEYKTMGIVTIVR